MKLLFLFLFSAFSLAARAQGADSTKMERSITLTKDQHKHVIRSLGTAFMSSPERFNYLNALIAAGIKTKADTVKITVTVTLGLIVDAFQAASQKAEGVVVNDNAATKAALLPQIQGIPWVRNRILSVISDNSARNQAEKDQVELYVQQLK